MMNTNTYEIIAETKWSVTTEYKGTNLEEAIAIFHELDNSPMTVVFFYINNERVEF